MKPDRRWIDFAILITQIGSVGVVVWGYTNYSTPSNTARDLQVEHRLSSLEEQTKLILAIDSRTTRIETILLKQMKEKEDTP